ncbi:MAG: M23 family metallopeptidase [Candidatus Neomarinimicrobiota bacterium]|nr:M23 family metallopeptidase [Candidatus Neomarinimicrobiota bacterium]
MKSYVAISVSVLSLCVSLVAQDYAWPVKVGRVVSSNFGDPRPRRFHAGLDIATKGTSGHEVVAVDTGYVERIRVSSNGYGRVLYQKLSDGKTAVYAHLDSFTELLDDIMRVEQSRRRSFEVEKYFRPNEMLVNKGDLLGYSGDSGGAFGPHLHFELRDTLNQPINPFISGFGLDDRHRPKPDRIAIIPLDVDARINGGALPQIFPLRRLNTAVYEFPDTIHVFGTVGMALSAIDEITGFSINYNITGVSLSVNDSERFRLEFDRYNFSRNHLMEITFDNSLRRLNDGDFTRLFITDDGTKSDFVKGEGTGRLALSPGYHTVALRLFDHAGNVSRIQGNLYYAPSVLIKAEIVSQSESSLTVAVSPDGNPFAITDFACYAFNSKGYPERKIEAISKRKDGRKLIIELPRKPAEQRILQFIGINRLGGVSEPFHLPYGNDITDHLTVALELSLAHLENSVVLEVAARGYFNQAANLTLKGSSERTVTLQQKRPGVFQSEPLKPEILRDGEAAVLTISGSATRETRFGLLTELADGREYATAISGDGQCTLEATPATFYDTTSFWIETVKKPVKVENGRFSSRVYQLQPFDRALRDTARVGIKLRKSEIPEKKNVYYYDRKEGWTFLPTSFSIVDRLLSAPLYSLEAVAIIEDTIPPRIHNFIPGPKSRYTSENLTKITGRVEDDLAGVAGHEAIEMILNGEKLFFEYQPVEKEVRYRLDGVLEAGDYTLNISASDQAGNRSERVIDFSVN